MKIAKSYREFIKINRKYNKKNTIKRIDHINGRRFVSYWEYKDWIGFIVNNLDILDDNIISYTRLMIGEDLYNNKLDEIKFLLSNIGIEVMVKENLIGKFRGLILTNRDVYYLVEDLLVPIYYVIEKV